MERTYSYPQINLGVKLSRLAANGLTKTILFEIKVKQNCNHILWKPIFNFIEFYAGIIHFHISVLIISYILMRDLKLSPT